jgi:predicted dienelactone hydrolase
VDAIVAMAGDAYLFGEQGLSSVQVPAMLLGGTADTGTPWDWGAKLAFEHISSRERTLVGLEGAEHFVPIASCDDMPFSSDLPEEYRLLLCQDPSWDKTKGLDVIHHLTTAFLRHELARDESAAQALAPGLYATSKELHVSVAGVDTDR